MGIVPGGKQSTNTFVTGRGGGIWNLRAAGFDIPPKPCPTASALLVAARSAWSASFPPLSHAWASGDLLCNSCSNLIINYDHQYRQKTTKICTNAFMRPMQCKQFHLIISTSHEWSHCKLVESSWLFTLELLNWKSHLGTFFFHSLSVICVGIFLGDQRSQDPCNCSVPQ